MCELKFLRMGLGHFQATENLARSFYCFLIPALRILVHPASYPVSSGESYTHWYPPWLWGFADDKDNLILPIWYQA